MNLNQIWAGEGPDDANGVVGALRSLAHRPVTIWAVTVAAFAVLHTAVLIGASYWRYLDAQRAWPQTQAVMAQWDAHAANLTEAQGVWGSAWSDFHQPTLDLDGSAVITQVLASSTAFALLLGAAFVLSVHGHRRLAGFGALVPAISVAVMGGVLARVAPLIPVPGNTPLDQLNLDQWPAALRDDRIALDRAMATTDTSMWWNALLAALVAVIAVIGVRRVLRESADAVSANGRPAPWRVGAAVGVLAVATSISLVGDSSIEVNLAVVTGVTAFLLAAAAASSSAFVVTVMTLGVVAMYWALAAAFDRSGGAPGGWGIGTSGAQSSATLGTTVALLLVPLVGWGSAEVWSRVASPAAARHDAGGSTGRNDRLRILGPTG